MHLKKKNNHHLVIYIIHWNINHCLSLSREYNSRSGSIKPWLFHYFFSSLNSLDHQHIKRDKKKTINFLKGIRRRIRGIGKRQEIQPKSSSSGSEWDCCWCVWYVGQARWKPWSLGRYERGVTAANCIPARSTLAVASIISFWLLRPYR